MREFKQGDRVRLDPKVVGEKWPALFKKFAESGRIGTVISVAESGRIGTVISASPTSPTTVQFDVKRVGAKPAVEAVPDKALVLIDE